MLKFHIPLASLLLLLLPISTCILQAEDDAPLNQPPEGFELMFNGENLDGWKGLVANPKRRAQMTEEELAAAQVRADEQMRAHWTVEDGILLFDGDGKSICSGRDYANFEMYVDWQIHEGGDSGIYLRGSPQVQIWDRAVGSGGLYNNRNNPRNPSECADNPAGEWNTFFIRMVGESVTVHLNGTLVVDNVTMENYWERNRPIYPCGQIELQNHGDGLKFRNIYIRELPAEEEASPEE